MEGSRTGPRLTARCPASKEEQLDYLFNFGFREDYIAPPPRSCLERKEYTGCLRRRAACPPSLFACWSVFENTLPSGGNNIKVLCRQRRKPSRDSFLLRCCWHSCCCCCHCPSCSMGEPCRDIPSELVPIFGSPLHCSSTGFRGRRFISFFVKSRTRVHNARTIYLPQPTL